MAETGEGAKPPPVARLNLAITTNRGWGQRSLKLGEGDGSPPSVARLNTAGTAQRGVGSEKSETGEGAKPASTRLEALLVELTPPIGGGVRKNLKLGEGAKPPPAVRCKTQKSSLVY